MAAGNGPAIPYHGSVTLPGAALRQALNAFGIEARSVTPLPASGIARHWLVETGEGRVVLRRYRDERSVSAIDFEHRLLRLARERGWPVPEPLRLPGRPETIAEAAGARFSLFPFLAGEPVRTASLGQRRVAGRLLARLHRDLRDFDAPGQRDGFGRAWELDLPAQAAGHESFNALLDRFGSEYPELAAGLRREKYRNLRELARLGYGDFPIAPAHGSFSGANLLFDGPELSGVLDFDRCRLDTPVYDIAASLVAECTGPPGPDAVGIEAARSFIEGYAEHRPLAEEEARLVVPLLRAAILWFCLSQLLEWAQAGEQRPVTSIADSVRGRFPALQANAAALQQVALAAAR